MPSIASDELTLRASGVHFENDDENANSPHPGGLTLEPRLSRSGWRPRLFLPDHLTLDDIVVTAVNAL